MPQTSQIQITVTYDRSHLSKVVIVKSVDHGNLEVIALINLSVCDLQRSHGTTYNVGGDERSRELTVYRYTTINNHH